VRKSEEGEKERGKKKRKERKKDTYTQVCKQAMA
jgi:hypothetical protein